MHVCVCVSSRDRDRQPMSRGDMDRRERRPRPEESRSKRQVPSRDLPHEGTTRAHRHRQTDTDRCPHETCHTKVLHGHTNRHRQTDRQRQVPSQDLPHEGTQTATDRRDMHYVDRQRVVLCEYSKFESNRIVTSVFDSIRNEHSYSKFLNTYVTNFLHPSSVFYCPDS